MNNLVSRAEIDRSGGPRVIPRQAIEHHLASTFMLAGAALLGSLVVPIGLRTVVEWSWLAGIVLVGLGVSAVSLGLLGLYSRTKDRSPWVAAGGAVSAVVAGTAGVILLVLSGITASAMALSRIVFSVGMPSFAALAFTMAAGYALGFLLSGLGAIRSAKVPDRTGYLLTGGGTLLLIPVVGELIRLVIGVSLPPWVIFPVLGVVALDTLAVGINLRLEEHPHELSGQ